MAHTHDHHHAPQEMTQKPYLIGMSLNLIFVLLELLFAKLANSLALFADAFHNLSDVLALVIAWLAVVLFKLKPSKKRTYGYHNVSVLAGLFNAILLVGAVCFIIYEGAMELMSPTDVSVKNNLVIIIASLGILVNGGTALLFIKTQKHDLNAKGAYLHMVADVSVSIGVVVSSFIAVFTGWNWLDPIISIAIGVLILLGSKDLLIQSLNLALNGVPARVDTSDILNYLTNHQGVLAVHDLHIWGLSTTEVALTAHIVIPEDSPHQVMLDDLTEKLRHEYHIEHITLQLEAPSVNEPCNAI